jgi:hypothetical protein
MEIIVGAKREKIIRRGSSPILGGNQKRSLRIDEETKRHVGFGLEQSGGWELKL